MRLKKHYKLAFAALAATCVLLISGCSSSTTNDTGDKMLAAGHALSPALQAEMQTDVAKQEAQEAALQAKIGSRHPTAPPSPAANQ